MAARRGSPVKRAGRRSGGRHFGGGSMGGGRPARRLGKGKGKGSRVSGNVSSPTYG